MKKNLFIHVGTHKTGSTSFNLRDLAINGEDVMKELRLNPGPKVGQILKKTMDYVLDDNMASARMLRVQSK